MFPVSGTSDPFPLSEVIHCISNMLRNCSLVIHSDSARPTRFVKLVALGVRIEVVIRLGCLRYFGKRNTCKGVLSREQFGKL